MLNQQATDQLRALKLTGMLEAWEQQREWRSLDEATAESRLPPPLPSRIPVCGLHPGYGLGPG